MIHKIIRQLIGGIDQLRSKMAITYYQFVYPGCKIERSYFAKGSKVFCSDSSTLKISNCYVKSGSKIVADHGAQVLLEGTHIGENCIIVSRSKIIISSNCQIAEMVVIRDQNHNFGEEGKTIQEQGFTSAPIFIGKNVWLGTKASVLAGSVIEDNVVVGAHSLVNGTLKADSLYVGTPTRFIRSINKRLPEPELLEQTS